MVDWGQGAGAPFARSLRVLFPPEWNRQAVDLPCCALEANTPEQARSLSAATLISAMRHKRKGKLNGTVTAGSVVVVIVVVP